MAADASCDLWGRDENDDDDDDDVVDFDVDLHDVGGFCCVLA